MASTSCTLLCVTVSVDPERKLPLTHGIGRLFTCTTVASPRWLRPGRLAAGVPVVCGRSATRNNASVFKLKKPTLLVTARCPHAVGDIASLALPVAVAPDAWDDDDEPWAAAQLDPQLQVEAPSQLKVVTDSELS